MKNRNGSGTPPERDGGNSSIEQKPRDQANWHPRHLNRGESTGRSSRPRDSPEHLHKWKPPFQPGGKQANTAKARPQAEKRKTSRFSIQCIPKSEDCHHRRNGEWPKEGGGTTGMTVPKTRHGLEPEPSHNLQENSYARFFQLDKTTVRRNRPVQNRSGLRQAPRGRGKKDLHKPTENPHKGKTRRGQD